MMAIWQRELEKAVAEGNEPRARMFDLNLKRALLRASENHADAAQHLSESQHLCLARG